MTQQIALQSIHVYFKIASKQALGVAAFDLDPPERRGIARLFEGRGRGQRTVCALPKKCVAGSLLGRCWVVAGS